MVGAALPSPRAVSPVPRKETPLSNISRERYMPWKPDHERASAYGESEEVGGGE